MYRFLATPRWLGLAALAVCLAAVMVGLGRWQLDRYHQRSEINARIDAGASTAPLPIEAVLPTPASGGGHPPPATSAWKRVTTTGVYDEAREILARGRTVDGRVGYEILTPLRLADGSAVLVDRGWVPPSPRGASTAPDVPPAPIGEVTVVGRVHPSESGARAVDRVDGRVEVRRVGVGAIASELPYPVYGAYLLLDSQTPPADPHLVAIPSDHQNAAQNAAYVVQWWLLAALTLVGYGLLARREAQQRAELDRELRDLTEGSARI